MQSVSISSHCQSSSDAPVDMNASSTDVLYNMDAIYEPQRCKISSMQMLFPHLLYVPGISHD